MKPQHVKRFSELPECCMGCKFQESDSNDEYSTIPYSFCTKGLFIPVNKGKCKKREAFK